MQYYLETANKVYTVFYRLIAAATITFSKTNCVATKRGRLLYEGGYYTRVATKPLWRTQAAVSMRYLHGKKFKYNIATYIN